MATCTDIEQTLEIGGLGFRSLPVGVEASRPVIGLGAELKATLCLLSGGQAWLSESLGDLREGGVYRQYRGALLELVERVEDGPPLLAHDSHPTYVSGDLARSMGAPRVAVQHHHAHAAASAAGAGVEGPVVAVVCDGTGYGTDGASWGGEVLYCEGGRFERTGHLRYCALPGGDASSRDTWRPAVSLLRDALGEAWQDLDLPMLERIEEAAIRLVARMLKQGINCPRSSSLGRLFDGVAAITGLCMENTQPAEAAIAMQEAASRYLGFSGALVPSGKRGVEPYEYVMSQGGPSAEIDVRAMIRQIAEDVVRGEDVGGIAARFHETVCAGLTDAARSAADGGETEVVVLSGGCFLNPILVSRLIDRLRARGLRPELPSAVPVGDDGVSLGQAVVVAEQLRRAS